MNSLDNKEILITGGFGYVGSTIATKLAQRGAHVTILTRHADRPAWIREERYASISIVQGDSLDPEMLSSIVRGKALILNFAASTNHSKSESDPVRDLEVNCKAPLLLLEACRAYNTDAKVVFPSTRLIYGTMRSSSIAEDHPTEPKGFYGIHKLAAEKYHSLYAEQYAIRSTVLRITNVYGEPMTGAETHAVPNLFMQQALKGGTIAVHGDGARLRDYIHIDDATDAIILAALSTQTDGKIYNLGSGTSISFDVMAKAVVEAAGSGSIEHVEQPTEFASEETGDVIFDIAKLSSAIHWNPRITFQVGAKRMFEFYKEHNDH